MWKQTSTQRISEKRPIQTFHGVTISVWHQSPSLKIQFFPKVYLVCIDVYIKQMKYVHISSLKSGNQGNDDEI